MSRHGPREYPVNGEKLTAEQIKRLYGVNQRTFYGRVQRGWSPQRAAVTPAPCPRLSGTVQGRYSVDGEDLTAGQIKQLYGVSQRTFYGRVQRGWEPQRAAGSPEHRARRYSINREELTAEQIEERYGVKERSFRARLRRGWEPERAAMTPALASPKSGVVQRRYSVDGEDLTARQIKQRYGVSERTFYGRVQRGWSPQRAAETPALASPKPGQRRYSVDGDDLTARQIKQLYGVSQRTFYGRVQRGWEPQRAVVSRPGHRGRRYSVNGEELRVEQIEERYGVKQRTFRDRLQRGWEPERAAMTPNRVPPDATPFRQGHYLVNSEQLTALQIEERYGVRRRTFYGRLRQGWEAERAAVTPGARSRGRRYSVNGEKLTAEQIEERYGVKRRTFCNRLQKGWEAERAVLPASEVIFYRRRYSVSGEELTVEQIEKRYGVKQRTFRDRLQRGFSAQDAATVAVRGRYMIHGIMWTITEITRTFGMTAAAFKIRLHKHGWSPERAAMTPVPAKRRHHRA